MRTRVSTVGAASVAVIAALAPRTAHAGAWIAPEGGQEIWTYAAGESDVGYFYETSAYYELPFSEAPLSFVVTPWMSQTPAALDGFRAEATLGLKSAVLRQDNAVVAIQAGALWMSEPRDGCKEDGAEVRALAGMSLGREGRGFLNVEAAGRLLEGGCATQRLEITAGYRANERWMALGQLFVDDERGGDTALKAQLTLVRFGDENRGIQFGLRARIDGEAAEPALVLGFWGRPGQ